MHVHTWDEREHLLFLASGVTTVRNMFGSPLQLTWREEIASGGRLGPTIVTAGPIVDGEPPVWPTSREVVTAQDAADAVAEHVEAGYDFIKVYNGIPSEAYDALLVAAEEAGLAVHGHPPDAVGIEGVLAGPQHTLEHLDGFETLIEAEDSPLRGANDFFTRLTAWQHADPARVVPAAERAAVAGVWVCPTITVYQQWQALANLEGELARPYLRFVEPGAVARWKGAGARFTPAMIESAGASRPTRLALVRALQEAGAGLLLGTDMGNPFVPAGFSLHWELAYFVEAGLSPYQALRAGTRSAAECLDQVAEFGAVRTGLRADLLLLKANPLEDVANCRRRVGVMVRGRWLSADHLERELETLAASYAERGR